MEKTTSSPTSNGSLKRSTIICYDSGGISMMTSCGISMMTSWEKFKEDILDNENILDNFNEDILETVNEVLGF
jgi:hypothetical protein